MDAGFEIGDFVLYINPGHLFHKAKFKITQIYIDGYNINSDVTYVIERHSTVLRVKENELIASPDDDDLDGYFIGAHSSQQKCKHVNKVKSYALGNSFWYCRDCKEEVK